MPIEFDCPVCGHPHVVDETLDRKRVLCKGCGRTVVVSGRVIEQHEERRAFEAKIQPQGRDVATVAAAGIAPSVRTPYGQAGRRGSSLYVIRGTNWALVPATLLSVLCMLMPWISWGEDAPPEVIHQYGTYIAGFELPVVVQYQLDKTAETVESAYRRKQIDKRTRDQMLTRLQAARASAWSLYSVYLIPILALLCLIDELRASRVGNNRWWLRLANSLTPLIVTVVVVAATSNLASDVSADSAQRENDIVSVGMGYWVAWLAALGSFVSIFTSPKPREDPQTPHSFAL